MGNYVNPIDVHGQAFLLPATNGSYDMIVSRFDNTLAKSEEMLELLVGPDGKTGYLADMNSAISSAPQVSVVAPIVDTSMVLGATGLSVPVFNQSNFLPIPSDSYTMGPIAALPSIDTSDFTAIPEPSAVTIDTSWSATPIPDTVYNAIISRILIDLQSGATGLAPAVEQAIYDRARTRQQADRDAKYQQLNNTMLGRHFQFPSGAMASALTDYYAESIRMDADINNNIVVSQGELAQKNSQFMMQIAVELEKLIRQTASESDNRSLEHVKSKATLLIQDYAERVRAYVAMWEGKKARVQAQAESLKGVIEGNKGQVEIFKAQYEALKTNVEAVSASNKAHTDVYLGEIQGFSEAEKAMAARNSSGVEVIKAKVLAAELEVRAATAEAEQTVRGYASEMGLREQVASDMAKIAAQVAASMISAVNANVSMGDSVNRSSSVSASQGSSISESHNYEHDPTS
jgi:hypothetical protein